MEQTQTKKDIRGEVLKWSAIGMSILFVCTFFIYFLIDKNYPFSDFAETISYCISKNPYNGVDGIHAIYPPFAFLPFYLFALICKQPLQQYIAGEMTLAELVKQPTYLISFFLFFAICLALILFLTAKISKFKGKNLACLLIIVATFAPIMYCFFRANNIMAAVIFVMLFFWLYNSEKKWQREIANLCLACAIAIKIYPIIIVLFFIKDRRFLDMLKTIVYALILLFLPFLLIQGGFANIKEIWANFTRFNSGEGREMGWTNISLDAFAAKIAAFVGLTGVSTATFYSLLSKVLRFGLLIATIVVFILAKKSKQRLQCISVALLTYELFMGVSYAYTLAFLIIPLTIYFMDFDKFSKFDKIYYGVCFAFIACPATASARFFFTTTIACMCLVVKCYIDLINEFKANRKSNNPHANDEVFVEPEPLKEVKTKKSQHAIEGTAANVEAEKQSESVETKTQPENAKVKKTSAKRKVATSK
jgi:hypothetical protein